MAAYLGSDVNRDDVSNPLAAALGYKKAQNPVFASILAVPVNPFPSSFCDHSKSSPAPHVNLQFVSRIGDSRSEACLINLPERVEIFWPVVADCESHPTILDAHLGGRTARLVQSGTYSSGKLFENRQRKSCSFAP